MRISAVVLAPALLLAALPAQGQMYKCVDSRGVTHYSDKPRPECKGIEVDIHGQEPISGKLQTYGTDLGTAERDFRKRQAQREREAQEQAKADEARGRRCTQLRAEQQRLLGARRPSVANEKGERRFLEASEVDARNVQLEAAIARDCR